LLSGRGPAAAPARRTAERARTEPAAASAPHPRGRRTDRRGCQELLVAEQLLICGTRTFAEEVADLAGEVPGLEVVGFVENLEPERCAQTIEGLPIHWVDDIAPLAPTHAAVCALVTTKRRRFTQQVEELGVRFTSVVHPTAHVSSRSS